MHTLPTLETARLRLRPYADADIAELVPLIGAREVAAATLRIAHPYTEQDGRDFLALSREPNNIWLVVALRHDGRQIGGIGLRVDQKHQHAELGYWLGVPYWGKVMRPRQRGKYCATDSKRYNCTASSPRTSSIMPRPAGFWRSWA
jgi:RimJ/RimL family protein N-acetyltransferase